MQLTLPIAEHFHSIQGEGTWVGTPMHFIRTAGCPVGLKATTSFIDTQRGVIPILSTGHRASMCQTYDGRYFTCDTDFHLREQAPVEELIGETHEKHICLTGGEPLAHHHSPAFQELFRLAYEANILIHIESSGTVDWVPLYGSWLTIAPKMGWLKTMIERADELKFLVDESFDFAKLPPFDPFQQVFLCPVNAENAVNQENVQRCLNLLSRRPNWRLSAQWHKFLGLR